MIDNNIKIEKYSVDKKMEWDSFCNSSKMPLFMFNRNYMEYHKDRFMDFSLMFYEISNDKQELVAIFPASIQESVITSHGGLTYGGFITGNSMKQHTMLDLFNELLIFAKKNNITRIIYKTIPHIYHKQGAEEDVYALYRNNAKILKIEPSTVINLKAPLKMPKGRKAQVGRAKREGVEIKDCDDFTSFIHIENDVLKEHHNTKAVHTADELNLLKSFFPENIKLFAAYYHGKMIAGTVVFIYENVVHTQYMAADDEAREIGALDLAIDTIIEKYKGIKGYIDFGISSEEMGRVLNTGLIAQKEGFGGRTNVYTTWEIDF
jgi:hypothetical protein